MWAQCTVCGRSARWVGAGRSLWAQGARYGRSAQRVGAVRSQWARCAGSAQCAGWAQCVGRVRSAQGSVRDGVAVPGDLGGRPPRHVHITQDHSVYVNVSSYHWPTGGACWEVTVAAGECGSPPPLEAPRWAHRKCLDRGFVRGPPRLAWLQRRAIRRRAGYQTRLGRLRVAKPGLPRRRRRKKVDVELHGVRWRRRG